MAGHRSGTKTARSTIETCARLKIEALTLYAFSVRELAASKNGNRLSNAIAARIFAQGNAADSEKQYPDAVFGANRRTPQGVQDDVRDAMERTAGNKGMVLCVALNYGGRAEIVDAMNAILAEQNGHAGRASITEESLARHMYTNGLPDPDLLIRTSGEYARK